MGGVGGYGVGRPRSENAEERGPTFALTAAALKMADAPTPIMSSGTKGNPDLTKPNVKEMEKAFLALRWGLGAEVS